MLVVDIETMPNPEQLKNIQEMEIKPSKTIKDPAKIQADIAEKRQALIDKMALSPLYGKIACIGFYGAAYKDVIVSDEKSMIQELFKRISGRKVITFNGKSFDFDFIIKRGILNGVSKLTDLEAYTDKYKAFNHADLMQLWCKYGEYISLNELAKVILGKTKVDFDVKQIPMLLSTPEGQVKLKEYCLQDCRLTYELAVKFGVAKELVKV